MSVLDRKLVRDLRGLRGQLITIALVVAAGVAAFVTLRSAYGSLETARSTYYERYRFGDVFAGVKRAPLSLVPELERIPGVATVYPRIVHQVLLPMPDLPEAATGRLVSVPAGEPPPLNGVLVRVGRMPDPGRQDEVVVLDAFATAHQLVPGDRIPVVINGTLRQLHIVGLGMSPEFVFAASPADFAADDKRNAVLWMDREILAPAFRMEGAFNDVVLRLQPGASHVAVRAELDRILEPYGGIGAVSRDKQTSHFMLTGELSQLEQLASVVPIIFLAVAAFLLNLVLARLVGLQRLQIAVFKAVGYRSRAIVLHYVKLASVIVVMGALAGTVLGAVMGSAMLDLYRGFFRFPDLAYELDVDVIAVAVVVSVIAGIGGAVLAVRNVARLPPAEAMRPPAPPTYRRSLLDRLGLGALLGQSATMVMREIWRRPLRTALSALGIAAAVGILVIARFTSDAFDHLVDGVMRLEVRADTSVTFYEPLPERAARELASLPGVLDAEGIRMVPVRLRAGSRFRDAAIVALPADARLRKVIDRSAHEVEVPAAGLAISAKLGEVLDIGVGDDLVIEVREGRRPVLVRPVTQLVDDAFGLSAYMQLDTLHALLHQDPSVTMVYLRTDPLAADAVRHRLQDLPYVAAISRTDNLIERFEEQSGGMMLVMTLIMTLFGTVIAVGVVYNNARVALSMRSRDLASLRVIGFTRKEISAILLGELAVQLVLAIPFGLLLGRSWASAIMSMADPEQYRLPLVISVETYLYAVLVTGAAGVISALLVRRKLDHLDLIGVLKSRE